MWTVSCSCCRTKRIINELSCFFLFIRIVQEREQMWLPMTVPSQPSMRLSHNQSRAVSDWEGWTGNAISLNDNKSLFRFEGRESTEAIIFKLMAFVLLFGRTLHYTWYCRICHSFFKLYSFEDDLQVYSEVPSAVNLIPVDKLIVKLLLLDPLTPQTKRPFLPGTHVGNQSKRD